MIKNFFQEKFRFGLYLIIYNRGSGKVPFKKISQLYIAIKKNS